MHVSVWAEMFAFKVSDGYEQGRSLGGGPGGITDVWLIYHQQYWLLR